MSRGPDGDEVYRLIRTRLLNNVIPPGTRVSIDGLARELAVSATRVREALLRLEGDDLLVKTPNKGYRSTPLLTRSELQELFQFRMLIEPWAAETVAAIDLGNPASRLQTEIDDFVVKSTELRGGRQRLIDHDTSFHHLILAATGNATIRRAFDRTHCHLHLFRLLDPVDQDGSKSLAEHQQVTTAIADRDPVAAAAAMRDHLTAAFDRFAQAF